MLVKGIEPIGWLHMGEINVLDRGGWQASQTRAGASSAPFALGGNAFERICSCANRIQSTLELHGTIGLPA